MITLPGLEQHQVSKLIPLRPIYVVYRGSHSHGTYVPPTDPQAIDDIDILAVFIPPIDHYFGTDLSWKGHHLFEGQYDSAAYEIRHYFSLCENANPDVLQSLWVRDQHIIHKSPEGEVMRASRNLFSSKLAYNSFGGYARGQIKRMTSYKDEGEDTCCPGVQYHTPECPLRAQRGRGSQKKFATGYMGMKRKALVEKYGYDCKNAAHSIRLIRMGVEFLQTGQLNVHREHDAQELIAIKQGQWELSRVKETCEAEFARLEVACKQSPLPEQPDREGIKRLLVETLCVAKQSEITMIAHEVISKRWNK